MERDEGEVTWEALGELAPLLGWLATLPLTDIRIEPIGLRAVYDRYHREQAAEPPAIADPSPGPPGKRSPSLSLTD